MELIRTRRYLRDLKRIGADASDIAEMEGMLVSDPRRGDVLRGLAGVRKMRFGIGSRGKRGGGRAIYFLATETAILMLAAYAKNEKADLTAGDRKAISALLKEWNDG